jgi:hypothetical protein
LNKKRNFFFSPYRGTRGAGKKDLVMVKKPLGKVATGSIFPVGPSLGAFCAFIRIILADLPPWYAKSLSAGR